jgi:hypothetical protein
LTKLEAETIQLRLESTQALFKARIVFVHRVVAMIHKNGSRATMYRMRSPSDAACIARRERRFGDQK